MASRSSPEATIGTMRRGLTGTPIPRLVVCIAAVFAVTALLYAVPVERRPLTSALAFLFIVLIVSASWGFRYSLFASLLAALGFSWLLAPVGRFWLSDLRDVLVLAALLVIGITTSRLSDRARREALNANQRRAEAEAEQQRFADLVNSVEGIVWEANAETFAFSFVSDQAERILGYPVEQWLREPEFWKDHLHPEDRERAVQSRLEAPDKRSHDSEYRMIAADGRVVWLRDLASVIVENGRATRLRGVTVDITERKQTEQARQELQEQWRAAFESNPTMYFIVDAAGKIASVNAFGAEQLGYSVSELVGLPVLNVFYEPDRSPVQKHASECFQQPGRMMRWEARKIRKDGTMLWVRETANTVVLKQRPVLLVVCENITEQKRAEEAARRSEKELRDVIETIPAMAFSIRPDGSTEFVNRRVLEYTGLSPEAISGPAWESTVHAGDLARHINKWRASMASGEPFENEVRHRGANGEYRWFLVRAVPLRDEPGNILKWYGILADIDDRKRAEALLTGEKRILEMVAKGDSLAQILDTLCRLAEEQASGVLASVLLLDGNRLRHGSAPSLPKAYTDAIDGAVIGPSAGSCGTAAFRGEQVIVEDIATDPLWADYRELALPHSLRACWSTPVISSQGHVIATFAMYYREPRSPSPRDQQVIEQITHLAGVAIERKLTQDTLRRSEAYLAEAQRLTHTGSWAWSPVTRDTLYWSEEMFRIFGLDPQRTSPPDRREFVRLMHSEDRDEFHERVENAIHEKTDFAQEYRIVLPDGTLKHLHELGHPVLDETGTLIEYVGTEVDVTERKRADLERERLRQLEADLAHMNRVTTMGELTASLAHELNQPIAAAITNANTCLRWLTRDQPNLAEARDAATRIVKDGTRAAEIIKRVRSFYKKGVAPQRELIDINEVAREIVTLLLNEAGRYSIDMRADLAPELPKVMADRVQVQQVLMNLMLNGIEAMGDTGGELAVTSRLDQDGQPLISVSDTGVGLPSDEADQLFNVFFTTKPQGTGMGLAISRSIIESHGGRLWASANQDRGATFHFTLPQQEAARA